MQFGDWPRLRRPITTNSPIAATRTRTVCARLRLGLSAWEGRRFALFTELISGRLHTGSPGGDEGYGG
jgi:hypothetical protein